ncbi:MAG: hypothetical protein FWC57_01240 [Endomicrobia bacterium]|nr:hypothetical protein [Endomicrobiia bacterium]
MKKILAVLFVSLLFCAAQVFAASLVTPNVIKTAFPAKSDAQVEKAILAGAKKRGWIASKTADGEIEAVLNIRVHMIAVTIKYAKDGYTIEYKNSSEMKYNAKKNVIHSKYNNWVENLDKSIQYSLNYSN